MAKKLVWVSRDAGSKYVQVWLGEKKPIANSNGSSYEAMSGRNDFMSLCVSHMEPITGLKLKYGQCVKVEFSAKVIDEGGA